MANEYALAASLLTAVVSFALMWRLSRSVRASPTPAAAVVAPAATAHDELLLRFVVDAGGQRQGETVAMDGDRVILKTPAGFAAVPADRLKPEGPHLRIEGETDWDAARKEGEAWRTRSHKEISYSPEELPKDA